MRTVTVAAMDPKTTVTRIATMRGFGMAFAAASFLALATIGAAVADDTKADSKTPAPLLSDILEASGVTANGYLDGTYSYLSRSSALGPSQDTNSFSLNQASLTVAYTPPTGFGILINPVVGTEACDGCYAPGYGSSGAHAGTSDINLLQGYVQYVAGTVALLGGKFVTLAGAEGAAPTGNANVTRSLIWWYSEPTTHVGVRAVYTESDRATFTFGVNNGWNNDGLVPNGGKTAELAMSLSPSKSFTFAAAAYYGAFDLGNDQVGNRALLDAVGTWSPTPAVTLVLNADWDRQDHASGPGTPSASWYGIAAYVNYAINSSWRTSLRGEHMDDRDGFIFGTATKVYEGTLTVGYLPTKHFELRVEARYDNFNPDGEASNHATQGWVQALYKF